jgi:phosphoribosyl-AMP cyclohydrolase
VLLKVKRLGDGNVCHTGTRTCFRPLATESRG